MDKEVFQLGSPVRGQLFAGRHELINELSSGLESRKVVQHFALIGYRRIGKSSVMNVVKDEIEKDKNIFVAYVDMQETIPFNIDEFLKVYTASVLEAYCAKRGDADFGLKVKKFIKNGVGELKEIISGFRGEIKDFFVFWFEKSEKKSLSSFVKESLMVTELLAEEKEKFVVMLDEFQDIENLGIDFEKSFRANAQQMRKTSFLIAGSQVSIMRKLMHSDSSPLYNMFVVKYVEELSEKEAAEFIKDRFKKAGVEINLDAIQEIIKLTNAQPYHLQWLGRACLFKKTKNTVTSELVKNAFNWAITEEAGHLEYAYSQLKGKNRAIITACAKLGPSEPVEIAKELHEESDNIRPFLPGLIDEGYLTKNESKYKIRDPVLEKYIKRKIT